MNTHPSPCVTCHVSHVTYQVSCVMCQVSGVFFQVQWAKLFFYKIVELVGGRGVINGAYPSFMGKYDKIRDNIDGTKVFKIVPATFNLGLPPSPNPFPHTLCHMSRVTCHMSHVWCHASGVGCQVPCATIFFLTKCRS